MKSIDQKLIENKYRQRRKEYLDRELANITERIQREGETLERLKRELDKETEDVVRLRQVSLARLLKSFRSHEDMRLKKEKAEAFRAALDYKLKQNEIEDLQYQKNLLAQELKQYDSIQSEYQSLLDLKRKMLETSILNQIRELEQELAECVIKKETVQKGWESGKKLCSSLTYLSDVLSDFIEDSTDAIKLWNSAPDQDQREELMKEIKKLNDLWKDFEQALQKAEITLPEEFECDFFAKNHDQLLAEQPWTSAFLNTLFDQLNAGYSGVRTVLTQLEQQRSEIEQRQFDLQWQIQASIEMN